MTIYEKIQRVAVDLQEAPLSKSGHNKFANFKYFELADFLPTVNQMFLEQGLAGYCSFDEDLATLTVVDFDTGEKVEVTSPMVSIDMKGANPIQALGAVETYQRRYLYLALLGISENDTSDAVSGNPAVNEKKAEQAKMIIGKIQGLMISGKDGVDDLMDAVEAQAKSKYGLADWRGLPLGSLQNVLKKLEEL